MAVALIGWKPREGEVRAAERECGLVGSGWGVFCRLARVAGGWGGEQGNVCDVWSGASALSKSVSLWSLTSKWRPDV